MCLGLDSTESILIHCIQFTSIIILEMEFREEKQFQVRIQWNRDLFYLLPFDLLFVLVALAGWPKVAAMHFYAFHFFSYDSFNKNVDLWIHFLHLPQNY